MGYKEELAEIVRQREARRSFSPSPAPEKRKKVTLPLKTIVFLLGAAAVAGFLFFHFFSGKSEEDLIREQFRAVAGILNKEKKEGVIVAAANMQKLGGYFCPVTHVEIPELAWLSGNLDREAIVRHAFHGRSFFNRLRFHFDLHEFGIHGENATVLFTVTLSGTLKNGERITEARELEAVLSKGSGKWLFLSCRVNELIKK
ncbi:MAG: hypothetical protein J6331_00605 [Lentisphaeria bacterium]|nr:hypothetical protein [Lentisphaeria bacterium]